MKNLIIVRHGNTFLAGETPLRVGCRTDLPLVEEARSRRAGRYLKERGFLPDRVVAAPLKRTMETARLLVKTMELPLDVETATIFSEIDYGPDEGKSEEEIMDRLGRCYLEREGGLSGADATAVRERGKRAIERWNADGVPPPGWIVDVSEITRNWVDFANAIPDGKTVLVVSSNGIIRFAPKILADNDYERFREENNLKVTTGGICLLRYDRERWSIPLWNDSSKGYTEND